VSVPPYEGVVVSLPVTAGIIAIALEAKTLREESRPPRWWDRPIMFPPSKSVSAWMPVKRLGSIGLPHGSVVYGSHVALTAGPEWKVEGLRVDVKSRRRGEVTVGDIMMRVGSLLTSRLVGLVLVVREWVGDDRCADVK